MKNSTANSKDLILNRIKRAKDLPSYPTIAMELSEMLEDPETTTDHIAELIKLDPSISSSVLRLSNTIAFSIQGKVSSIDKAIVRLGFRNVKDIVLTIALIRNFKNSGLVDIYDFWNHSICVAFAADVIKKFAPDTSEINDDLYTAGLLHDIGIMILNQYAGEAYEEVLNEVAKTNRNLLEVEKDILGTTHTEVSGFLLETWGLPKTITNSVKNHQEPYFRSTVSNLATNIIHMADFACNNRGICNGVGGESETFCSSSWDALGLTIEDIPGIIEEVDYQTAKARELLAEAL